MARRTSSYRGRNKSTKQKIREGQDKADNKMAMQVTIGSIVALVLVFGFLAMSGGDDDATPERRKKDRDGSLTAGIPDGRVERPDQASQLPYKLACKLMLAIANSDTETLDEIVWWDKLFDRIQSANNIDEERRYDRQDEAGKAQLRGMFALQVFEPDYITIIRDNMLDDLLAGKPHLDERINVEGDYGTVIMRVKDRLTGEKALDVSVMSELLPGYDPIRDAQNPSAWRVVAVSHEQYGRVNDQGQRIRSKSKDFGDQVFAKPKKAKRKKGSSGPPESEPHLIDWHPDFKPEDREAVTKMVAQLIDLSNPREGDAARDGLIERGYQSVPSVLNALISLDHSENVEDTQKGWQLVQVLREVTKRNFGYGPANTGLGFGMGGMTRATPEERLRAVRRWFGWWDAQAAGYSPYMVVTVMELDEDDLDDEDGDG
ncbi:MAG: hypothetical protein KDB53_15485 [Planctomycetes bacterium]|nr:hypothetical protein [Planctomycetota bacterium]